MKKQLLIITKNQFGYHIDGFKYCEYLSSLYDITYLCWDYHLQKFFLPNVKIIYLSRKYSIIRRNYEFVKASVKEIRKGFDLTLIKYFNGCSLLRIFNPSKLLILDVRSGIISSNKIGRYLRDTLLRFEISFFKKVTIISSSLAKKIGRNRNIHILPLGADIISPTNKKFHEINLLYVGTFSQRNILETVKGFHKFYLSFKEKIKISYTIIGYGYHDEEKELLDYITKNKLREAIRFAGFVPHNELKHYFDNHNVGVSYIPITKFFDCQPPTKTYEYILSGMPVLATQTSENKNIVTEGIGILIQDNPEMVYQGLCKIFKNRNLYDSETIRNSCKGNTWENITLYNLKPYFEKVSKN